MAEIVRRRSWGGVLPLGRHVSISGSSLIQCASVSIALSSFQDGQNAIPVRRFKVEQALGMGGVETLAAAVRADLAARLPSQNKKQREGLALLVATALDVRSVNLMELAAAVPRAAERLDMRYQWISRLLGNAHIDVEAVMAPYAREVLARACAG